MQTLIFNVYLLKQMKTLVTKFSGPTAHIHAQRMYFKGLVITCGLWLLHLITEYADVLVVTTVVVMMSMRLF